MFDISEQLFPNIITILVQLCATGVIFLFYKKKLHQPVLELMDKKAEDFQREYLEVEALKKEQIESRNQLEEQKRKQVLIYEEQKKRMIEELEAQRDTLMRAAQQDVDSIKNQASIQIEQERVAMLRSVEKQIIEVSSLMVDKVLDGYTFDENQMVQALEKEFKNSHAQS